MSDISAEGPVANASARRRSRQERQARVGLLRNLNTPPHPAPRRAQLMGKWPNLRSSRRATPRGMDGDRGDLQTQIQEAVLEPRVEPVQWDQSGQVAAINIDGLMESVRDIGTAPPSRAPFFAYGRRDENAPHLVTAVPEQRPPAPADSWEDAAKPDVRTDPEAPTWRARLLRGFLVLLGGFAVFVVVLGLLPFD